ncbi:hypothetical protein CPB84DRAFT_1749660 [Gymnopilus junonius]|uniref:Uncharacterized protein n=1 Tax=Gymnopilus junonius TaxID=109634 RepID=A0A9P5NH22_GYMJU|nr:hypothetical protein CPB84DRAFT_1749660 [Gymnopilus junonius]
MICNQSKSFASSSRIPGTPEEPKRWSKHVTHHPTQESQSYPSSKNLQSPGLFKQGYFVPKICKFLLELIPSLIELEISPIYNMASSFFTGCSLLKSLHVTNLEIESNAKLHQIKKAQLKSLLSRQMYIPLTRTNPKMTVSVLDDAGDFDSRFEKNRKNVGLLREQP